MPIEVASAYWRRAILALLASAWIPVVPAAAADWSRLEVDGFTLIGDVDERRLKAIATDLRLFRYAIGRYITTVPSGDAMPIRVLASSEATWERHLRPREGLAGFFIPGLFDGDILIDADHGWDSARMTVYHEYTHHYMHNLDKFPYPVWFNEGLAQFLSTTARDGRSLILGRMPYGNWLKTGDDSWIPLSRLAKVDHDSPEYIGHEQQSQFYLQSWLFVHYMLVGDQSLRDGLNAYLGDTVNGGDPAVAAAKAFGRSFETLDSELKSYFRKQNFRVLKLPAPAKIDKVKEKAAPLSEQEAMRALGLAALRGHPQDPQRVAPVFKRLLEIDAGDTTAMAGLALTLVDEDEDEADRWIKSVEESARADPMALRLCGDFHIEQLDGDAAAEGAEDYVARARECYQRAFAADPADDYALIGMARLSESRLPEDSSALISSLERALGRYPQSEYLALELARIFYNTGEDERALATLRRAISVTRDPAMRRELAVLLRKLSR